MSSFNKGRFFINCPPDCPTRKPGCHDHCEKYQTSRAKLDEINRQKRLKYEASAYVCESVNKRLDRRAKLHRKYPKAKFHP